MLAQGASRALQQLSAARSAAVARGAAASFSAAPPPPPPPPPSLSALQAARAAARAQAGISQVPAPAWPGLLQCIQLCERSSPGAHAEVEYSAERPHRCRAHARSSAAAHHASFLPYDCRGWPCAQALPHVGVLADAAGAAAVQPAHLPGSTLVPSRGTVIFILVAIHVAALLYWAWIMIRAYRRERAHAGRTRWQLAVPCILTACRA